MAARSLMLLLPLAAATINVEISGPLSEDLKGIKMNLSGRQVNVVTDMEMEAFQLNEDTLIRAVESYTGKHPNGVYLHSPTPWGDLYDIFNWQQVVHTLEPRKPRILSVNQEKTTIKSQTFVNEKPEAATYNVAVSDVMTNVISSWSEDNLPGKDSLPSKDIDYRLDIEMMKRQPMSFQTTWGKRNSTTYRTMAAPVDSKSMDLVLRPKSAVISELQATNVTMRMEIPYKSSLHGMVAVHFEEKLKGHDFWGFAVEKVMRSANLRNGLMGKQIVDISLQVNPRIVVTDKDTGDIMLEKSL